MKELKPHPLAELFPIMPASDIKELADDIKARGLQNPITLFDGKILDGQHRYEACCIAEVKPKFEVYRGDDPIGFVIAANLKRRHLTTSQKAMVAAAVMEAMDDDTSAIRSMASAERFLRERELAEIDASAGDYDERSRLKAALGEQWAKAKGLQETRESRRLYAATFAGGIKIGISSAPKSRIASLATACPGIKFWIDCPGDFALEKKLLASMSPLEGTQECVADNAKNRKNIEEFMEHAKDGIPSFASRKIEAVQRVFTVSPDSIKTASRILDESPALAKQVRDGKISVHAASEKLAERKADREPVLDETGWPIPDAMIALWQRRGEVREMLATVANIEHRLKAMQEAKDELFSTVNFSSAMSKLQFAHMEIKAAQLYAVCTACQGRNRTKCVFCKGRGFIAKHIWDSAVPAELKAIRAKAAK